MEIGTASADSGTTGTGWLSVTDLPTGGAERLPVTIVNGEHDGPTLWVTASIHGDELTPLATAHDLTSTVSDLTNSLRGTLVCLPLLNPAGIRVAARRSYYHHDDPNRYFPAFDRSGTPENEDRSKPPRTQERIDRQIHDAISASADCVLDLHTAQIGSLSYLIRDQVCYGTERTREEAIALNDAFETVIDAFGLPVVSEYPIPEYFERNFHRTLSGATLNSLGVPAATIELGGHSVVDEPVRERALAGLGRVMVALDMLEGVPDALRSAGSAPGKGSDVPVSYPVKRHDGPRVGVTGLVRHRVASGDALEPGDPVADVVTPHGEVLETVTSDHDGVVLARRSGLSVYANDPVCSVAIRDASERVVPRNDDIET